MTSGSIDVLWSNRPAGICCKYWTTDCLVNTDWDQSWRWPEDMDEGLGTRFSLSFSLSCDSHLQKPCWIGKCSTCHAYMCVTEGRMGSPPQRCEMDHGTLSKQYRTTGTWVNRIFWKSTWLAGMLCICNSYASLEPKGTLTTSAAVYVCCFPFLFLQSLTELVTEPLSACFYGLRVSVSGQILCLPSSGWPQVSQCLAFKQQC